MQIWVRGIEGATVTVRGTNQSATTDIEGRYTIPDVEEGVYALTATAEGYSPKTETVNVNGDTTVNFAFNLHPPKR